MADEITVQTPAAEQPTATSTPETPKPKPQIFESNQEDVKEETWDSSLAKKKQAAKAKQTVAETPTPANEEKPVVLAEGTITPEVAKTDEQPAEEKPKPKKERLKKFLTSKEEPAVTSTDTTTPAAAAKVELPKEVESELNQLRALVNKPSVKMVLQAEESGKDFSTYYEELKSRDPYKLPYNTLYEMQLRDQGLSDSEIKRKLDKFNDPGQTDEDDQLDKIATFRKSLKEKFDSELKNYTPSTAAPEPPENTWETKVMPAYQAAIKNYENKELNGIMVTPQEAQSLSDYYKNNTLVKMKDGMPDPEDLARVTHLVKNYDLIVNQIYESGFNEGVEKLQEEVIQPLNAKTGSHTTQPRKTQTDTEKRVANLKASLPNQPTATK